MFTAWLRRSYCVSLGDSIVNLETASTSYGGTSYVSKLSADSSVILTGHGAHDNCRYVDHQPIIHPCSVSSDRKLDLTDEYYGLVMMLLGKR